MDIFKCNSAVGKIFDVWRTNDILKIIEILTIPFGYVNRMPERSMNGRFRLL